jgi:hypothetical protein
VVEPIVSDGKYLRHGIPPPPEEPPEENVGALFTDR